MLTPSMVEKPLGFSRRAFSRMDSLDSLAAVSIEERIVVGAVVVVSIGVSSSALGGGS